MNNDKIKAVGLISGGLDSTLAAKMIKDLGFDVHGVYFSMPWGCCDKAMAIEAAEAIGINFIVLRLDERYLEIVKKPKFGYGSALNPCVDCRIHMFSRAAQYMRHIGAKFLFTGEVLGQRPKSQRRHSMKWIEQETGIEGLILRPLSAQLLEPTLVEKNGIVNRSKLLRMSGRSRKQQYALAKALNISSFNQPAGGCLLTDKNFANRMKDSFKFGYRDFRETVALQWGRHYRINENIKIIVGRDDKENQALMRYAHPNDFILELKDFEGPTVILKSSEPDDNILQQAAGYVQRFSKYKQDKDIKVKVWKAGDRNQSFVVQAQLPEEKMLDKMKV